MNVSLSDAYRISPISPTGIGTWGYIDRTGKTLIGPNFNGADKFHDGYASVCLKGVSEYSTPYKVFIDKHGQLLNGTQFFKPGQMSEGMAVVHTPFIHAYKPVQRVVHIDDIHATYCMQTGVILSSRFIECGSFSGGNAICCVEGGPPVLHVEKKQPAPKESQLKITDQNGNKFVVLDRNLRYVLINKVQKILKTLPGVPVDNSTDRDNSINIEFSEGKLPMSIDSKVGYIDVKGDFVIPPQFEAGHRFQGGLAAVKSTQGSWGFIDKTGKVVVPCSYKRVSDFHDGLARVETDSGKAGFIDKTNSFIFTVLSYSDWGDFSEGFVQTHRGYKYYFYDQQGHQVFESKGPLGDFHQGLCSQYISESKPGQPRQGFFGYLNKQFKLQIKPAFLWAADFSEGAAAVCFYDKAKMVEEIRYFELEKKKQQENEPWWQRWLKL